jgi:hypothetical protein
MRSTCRLVLGIALVLAVCGLPSGAYGQALLTRDAVARAVGQLDLRPDRQPPQTSSDWAAVMALSSGARIRVTMDDGQPVTQSTFRRASADSVIVKTDRRELSLPRAHVVEISAAEGASRGHHAALGFLIGGLGGVVAAIIHCHGWDGACMEGSPGYFWPGGAVGAGIGASMPVAPWRLVYSRRSDR